MSMSTMGENAEIPIPAGWAGQIDSKPSLDSNRPLTNGAITAALQAIDHDIDYLTSLRASLVQAGFVKLTDARDVTNSAGLAVPATELNPAIKGTLANQVKAINDRFEDHFTIAQVQTEPIDVIGYGYAALVANYTVPSGYAISSFDIGWNPSHQIIPFSEYVSWVTGNVNFSIGVANWSGSEVKDTRGLTIRIILAKI